MKRKLSLPSRVERRAEPVLEALRCPSCGAAVALLEGDVLSCEHCHAAVAVPAEHAALRDAAKRSAAADTDARALYARLAKRPTWLLRVLSGWFSPLALAVGVYPAMFIAGVFVELGVLAVVSRLGPSDLFDTIPETTQSWASIVIGFVLAYVGTILGVFGQRRSVARSNLQAALAAREPAVPGGAFACRMCGAPLVVAAGALGARCIYCRADNLLEVPEPWLKKLDAQAVAVAREARSAREAWAGENARIRRQLLRYVAAVSAVSALFLLGFVDTVSRPAATLDDWPPSWLLFRSAPPLVLEHGYTKRDGKFWYPVVHRISADPRAAEADAAESTTTELACHGGACELRYYAALARGDALAVEARRVPDGATLAIEAHASDTWDADDDYRGSRRRAFGPAAVAARAIRPGERVELRAERNAWHRVVVRLPGEAAARTIALRFELTRPHAD